MKTLTVKTQERRQMIDVTSRLQEIVADQDHLSGFVYCFVPHTTAAITINENADPDVTRDILYKLGKEIPQSDGYHHAEGNSDAHVQASLVGSSQQILIENGRLVLGTWQAVYFCEFDGPRQRQLIVKVAPLD
ncbi:MAG: secondary thiamine-phosphate synthase enzyme YjbQ [candidate division Zixibacteria bacterium]|nr:secondary thiamine-phosphate synthase enzyme YjbQ [candidate division Zixibacteria bacterium]MDH3938190.1 secondary thiamine-phosphate synthase enzyme YjbQ [candidate division Zixibacteria bacterium]MDH4033010.1 secondary thiamine-phosphate synthase enzyme YjbQ [candidate division Zixibacteria bacterium]